MGSNNSLSLYEKVNPSIVIVHGYLRIYNLKQKSLYIPPHLWNTFAMYYECDEGIITTDKIGGKGGGPYSHRNKDKNKDYCISSIAWGTHNLYSAMPALFFECVRLDNDQIEIISPIDARDLRFIYKSNNLLKRENTKLCENNKNEWCIGANVWYGGALDGIRCVEFITNKNNKKLIGLTENELKTYEKKLKVVNVTMANKWFKMVGIEGKDGWLTDSISFVFIGPKFIIERLKC